MDGEGHGINTVYCWFARLQIPEGADIRQRQGHAELALTPQRSQIVILVLNIDRETTKIIADLTDRVLEYLLLKVVIHPERAAQPPMVGVTVSHHRAQQVKGGQRRGGEARWTMKVKVRGPLSRELK